MKICAHCGDEMRGYAMAGDRWLCHPDPPHLDCYHLVTVYHHAMAGSTDECDGCSRAVVSAARAQAERWHDGSGASEDEPHESNYGRVGCAPTRKAPRRPRVVMIETLGHDPRRERPAPKRGSSLGS